ncbi:tetratricopeptide repeat protein [Lacibacter cauensis]|uniref:Regulator of microtubule dynamics protein 1 n=1 Tax=Lacibacter cauensis TaxID=510947 RepID=A0A562SWK8_9BACT|nr:tetratricopeptide repeat protein [Lacibacter cauensis]TWI85186.1 tetratricopeptide repeat protein [Lacibacter cauensis]
MMRFFLVLFFIAGLTFATTAQTADDLVKQGDLLEKQLKEDEAYQKFKEAIKLNPVHVHALVRCSELASRIGRRQATKEKQMDFYQAAKIYAERALKINPRDSEANVVMSLAYARMSLLKSGKEKVEYVREIKNYADRALVSNPNNFKALFVIARWHFEVSNLNAMEKAAVKVFFGGLQKNSLDSAIHYYEKVKAISPNFVLNYLELAKAYNRAGKKEKAVEALNHLLKMPNTAADDPTVKAEARELLKSWKQ